MTPDPDYMGGLECPDLRPHFKHLHWRVMGHSFGRLVASDWADKPDTEEWRIWKECGLWCREEAAILYHCANQIGGVWVDIGSNVGWTSMHIGAGGARVIGVDPILRLTEFYVRTNSNTSTMRQIAQCHFTWKTSDEWFISKEYKKYFDGFCIDGDHLAPHPLRDAQNAAGRLADTGVILMHDCLGDPVQEAVRWLQDNGFRTRIYITPHVVACCWRGDFVPPVHIPEPAIVAQDLPARMPLIDWSRTE